MESVNPNSDPFQGLTGYKRDINGRPTSINGQQPAFRGTPNKPGDEVRAPAIRSSSNHPDRKSNVTIPYTRSVPVSELARVGRLSPGDVAFVSVGQRKHLLKADAGSTNVDANGNQVMSDVAAKMHMKEVPQYYGSLPLPGSNLKGQNHLCRLVGVDFMNKQLGNSGSKMADGVREIPIMENWTTRTVLVGSDRVGDEWRAVPFLQDWTLDGVVLSNDQPATYYGVGHEGRQAQDFNMCVQGPAPVNNGYGALSCVRTCVVTVCQVVCARVRRGPFWRRRAESRDWERFRASHRHGARDQRSGLPHVPVADV